MSHLYLGYDSNWSRHLLVQPTPITISEGEKRRYDAIVYELRELKKAIASHELDRTLLSGSVLKTLFELLEC